MLYNKLKSGTLKKHSEQMNKWTAGFLDSDGCISLHVKEHSNGRYGVYIQVSIAQTDTEILHLLHQYYNTGGVCSNSWHMSGKDARKFLNLIGKHLLIKAKHMDNLLWLVDELDGVSIEDTEDVREFSKCSRLNSKWRKEPKHVPYAWLAGYLDGDGHYRARINRIRKHFDCTISVTNELKLFVGCAPWDSYILDKLHHDHGGSIRMRKDNCYFWQLALGKNSRSKALPFLRKLRKYTCLPRKAEAIDRMITFHTTRRD